MIVFDLRCAAEHVFEAWFASSAAYEDQRARSLVSCPVCGVTAVEKAVMAPNIAQKGNTRPTASPAEVKAALHALAAAQRKALDGSRWVGRDFANQARAMHVGEQPVETIHGQATIAEAKSLIDDGVDVAALPLPVVPPVKAN
jgi:hypothetical protein